MKLGMKSIILGILALALILAVSDVRANGPDFMGDYFKSFVEPVPGSHDKFKNSIHSNEAILIQAKTGHEQMPAGELKGIVLDQARHVKINGAQDAVLSIKYTITVLGKSKAAEAYLKEVSVEKSVENNKLHLMLKEPKIKGEGIRAAVDYEITAPDGITVEVDDFSIGQLTAN